MSEKKLEMICVTIFLCVSMGVIGRCTASTCNEEEKIKPALEMYKFKRDSLEYLREKQNVKKTEEKSIVNNKSLSK